MKELSSLDQKILHHKVESVFDVVSDFSTYQEWFPSKSVIKIIKQNPNKVGSIIELKIGLVKFRIEIQRLNRNKEIFVGYTGAYEGIGIWYFFETVNGTKLMYEIDLVIKNPIVRIVSLFVNITHFHSKMMAELFLGLEKYLNKIHNQSYGIDNNCDTQQKIFSISGN